jgi:hypothetical protein
MAFGTIGDPVAWPKMGFVINAVKCKNCGELVRVDDTRLPLHYATREADACEPRALVILGRNSFDGGDWLLHRCVIRQ